MKKMYFFGLLIVALVLIVGCVAYTNNKSVLPEQAIKSMLPNTWVITSEQNTKPTEWSGASGCLYIKAENPSEIYEESFGHFNYSAFHNFWFCPNNWDGQQNEISPVEQRYPAGLLCDCKDYKIFHLSMGENSEKDLPEKIKNEFIK